MAVDAEVVVVHPFRVVHAQRHEGEFLAVAGRPVEPRVDVVAQLLERRAWGALRRVEDGGPADVHVCGRRLGGQEGRVEGGQAGRRHVALLHSGYGEGRRGR